MPLRTKNVLNVIFAKVSFDINIFQKKTRKKSHLQPDEKSYPF